MHFRIADTFTASLVRMTGEEQKLVKATAFDLPVNPEIPGLSFYKLPSPASLASAARPYTMCF